MAELVRESDGVVRAVERMIRGPAVDTLTCPLNFQILGQQRVSAAGSQQDRPLAREEMHEVGAVHVPQTQQVSIEVHL